MDAFIIITFVLNAAVLDRSVAQFIFAHIVASFGNHCLAINSHIVSFLSLFFASSFKQVADTGNL